MNYEESGSYVIWRWMLNATKDPQDHVRKVDKDGWHVMVDKERGSSSGRGKSLHFDGRGL